MAMHFDSTPSSLPAPPSLSDIIDLHGFAVVTVGYGECRAPDCRCPTSPTPWCYTVGLTSFGHPELVVLGPGLDELAEVLYDVAARRCDDPFPDDEDKDEDEDELDDVDVRVIDVPARWVSADRSRMAAWFEHYGRQRLPVVEQLLLPDRDGCFPDDPRCDPVVRRRQPVLRDNPLRYPQVTSARGGRHRRRR